MAKRPRGRTSDEEDYDDLYLEAEEENETRDFTAEERKQIRGLLERYEHRVWLRSVIGIWAKWLGYVGGGVVAAKLLYAELQKFVS